MQKIVSIGENASTKINLHTQNGLGYPQKKKALLVLAFGGER